MAPIFQLDAKPNGPGVQVDQHEVDVPGPDPSAAAFPGRM